MKSLILSGFLFVITSQLGLTTDWYVATVAQGSANGTSWENCTDSIQYAIDQSSASDTVWVSNGVYNAGWTTNRPSGTVHSNRVAIINAVSVKSANNDPINTIIDAGAGGRGVYMADGSSLSGFTVTNGRITGSSSYGGGIYAQSGSAIISNCVIRNCYAQSGAGGVHAGALYYCLIATNSTVGRGGGAYDSTLYNCAVISNSASDGGGILRGVLYNCLVANNTTSGEGGGGLWGPLFFNCTIVSNSAGGDGGGFHEGYMYNSISWNNNKEDSGVFEASNSCGVGYNTLPDVGSNNITNNPQFVNSASGNYRLSENSPCRNAGTNYSWMTDSGDVRSRDLDGNPRIIGNIVDMGCYEFNFRKFGNKQLLNWWRQR